MSSPKPHQGFMQLSPFLPPPLQTVFHLLSLIVLSCLFPLGCAGSPASRQVSVADACATSCLSRWAALQRGRVVRARRSHPGTPPAWGWIRQWLPCLSSGCCWIIAAGWESSASPGPPADTTCSAKRAGLAEHLCGMEGKSLQEDLGWAQGHCKARCPRGGGCGRRGMGRTGWIARG